MEETAYYLGKVKPGSIVEKDFKTEYIPKLIVTSCECLKVELKKKATKADLLHIRLDTSGYKGYNTLYFYLVLSGSQVMKVNLSFEVDPVRESHPDVTSGWLLLIQLFRWKNGYFYGSL